MSDQTDARDALDRKIEELGRKLQEVNDLWYDISVLIDKVEPEGPRRDALRQQVAGILSPGLSPLKVLIGLHYGGLGMGGMGGLGGLG